MPPRYPTHSERGDSVAQIRFLRCDSVLVLGCLLLPCVASCSRERGPDPAKGTDHDQPSPADPQAARLKKVIDDATEAIRLDPKAVDGRSESPYARRGKAYRDKGEYDKAISDYTEAIQVYQAVKPTYLRARSVEVYEGRATCYQKKRDYEKAIADYGEVIQISMRSSPDPGEVMTYAGWAADAYYQRGICYDETGNHAKAMTDYQEVVRLAKMGYYPDRAKNEDVKRRMGK
jgi:tetratricopeptide (TPR) repeat protein